MLVKPHWKPIPGIAGKRGGFERKLEP